MKPADANYTLKQRGMRMTEDELNKLLDSIHERLKWVADTEARAAWVGGFGANGELDGRREELLIQAESILRRLEAIGGSPKFNPK